jgi:hypothetical protein
VNTAALRQRHQRIGWWSLGVFLTLGLVLEALHGFKVGWYLDVSNQMRRLVWTLAHAHGTLLGLIHLAFAHTLDSRGEAGGRALAATSVCLTAATLLLPGGFFLGGVWIYAGDPGLGILLVPVGGVLLAVAVFLRAWTIRKDAAPSDRAS